MFRLRNKNIIFLLGTLSLSPAILYFVNICIECRQNHRADIVYKNRELNWLYLIVGENVCF